MLLGALGDIHGAFDTVQEIMRRHPEVPHWISVGDVASNNGEYFTPIAPLYWIKGNNEDFDFVSAQPRGSGTLPNLHYIPNGTSVRAGGLSVAGLGGALAPTWDERAASELRRISPRDDRRRHFVHEEVDACKALPDVDIFLSHEAPRPYPLPRVRDAGKTPINEILSAMRPRLHLFGHHHKYTVAERQHVPSIGLDAVSDSYLLFDGKTLAHQRLSI